MTAQEKLIAIYEQAEKRLFAIIQKKGAFASAAVYERSLLQQVQKELNRLKANSAKTVDELVIENYQSSLNELIEDLKKIGAPIDMDISPAQLSMSKLNTRQIEMIARNVTGDFNKAVDIIGRRTKDMIRTVTLEATAQKLSTGQTVRQMQKSLTEIFKAQNVMSVPYKNGANMPIKKYAEMTARSTTAEAQNKAQTTQGIDWGYDLVRMTDHSPTCPICAMYQGRVYAITKEAANGKYKAPDGTPLMFPYLYDTAFVKGYETIHPNCRHRIAIFPARAYKKEELLKFSQKSTAPFEDTRTDAERKAYAEQQAEKRRRNENRKQYERIKAVLPNDAPKSFAGFVCMKQANSEKYQELMSDYRYIMRVANQDKSGIINNNNTNRKYTNDKQNSTLKEALGNKGVPLTIKESRIGANPLRKKFKGDKAFTENCQRCVIAYEARRRGYRVIAQGTYGDDQAGKIMFVNPNTGIRYSKWMGYFQKARPKKVGAPTPQKTQSNLENQMKLWGEGSRAVMQLVWNNNEGAHVINVEYKKGKVRYIDSQLGVERSEQLFFNIKTEKTQLVRTDNLKFSERAKYAIIPEE